MENTTENEAKKALVASLKAKLEALARVVDGGVADMVSAKLCDGDSIGILSLADLVEVEQKINHVSSLTQQYQKKQAMVEVLDTFNKLFEERAREIEDALNLEAYLEVTPDVEEVNGISIVEPLAPVVMKMISIKDEYDNEELVKREVLAIRAPEGHFAVRVKYGTFAVARGKWFGVVKDFVFDPEKVTMEILLSTVTSALRAKDTKIKMAFQADYLSPGDLSKPVSFFPKVMELNRTVIDQHNGMHD